MRIMVFYKSLLLTMPGTIGNTLLYVKTTYYYEVDKKQKLRNTLTHGAITSWIINKGLI